MGDSTVNGDMPHSSFLTVSSHEWTILGDGDTDISTSI